MQVANSRASKTSQSFRKKVKKTLWNFKNKSEIRIETALKRPFYYDENGEKVEYDDVYFVGGTEIKIEPMKKEKAKALVEKMERIENALCYDAEISKILEEELAPYFEGQKGAQEVADIIQSRIGVYVKENRSCERQLFGANPETVLWIGITVLFYF